MVQTTIPGRIGPNNQRMMSFLVLKTVNVSKKHIKTIIQFIMNKSYCWTWYVVGHSRVEITILGRIGSQ